MLRLTLDLGEKFGVAFGAAVAIATFKSLRSRTSRASGASNVAMTDTSLVPAPTVAVVSESAFTVRDHGVHTAFIEQVRALRALGTNVAMNKLPTCRRARLTVTHTPGPFARAALRVAGARGVAYAHVTPQTLAESLRFEPSLRLLARAYLGRFYRAAPTVVAVSTGVEEELHDLGVEPGRIRKIPNGIDGERIAGGADPALVARIRARHGGRALVIGVGQLQPRKGIDAFLAVARLLPHYRFAWIGGRPFGPLTAAPENSEAPANAIFVGRVCDAELLAWYHAADVFLFPSRQENFGQVVVEAAAAGLPLVLSELRVFDENFAPGAILCGDVRELAVAVFSLIEEPTYRAERVAASQLLTDRFSARRSAQALLALVSDPPLALPSPTMLARSAS